MSNQSFCHMYKWADSNIKICPDQMSICMSQDSLSEGGSVMSDASDVVGLITVVFNLTKRQKRLRQLRRGSSCFPMSPSVIYTVTASYGRRQKATYCRKKHKSITSTHYLFNQLTQAPLSGERHSRGTFRTDP